MPVSELVDNTGLGFAADLAPLAPTVFVMPEGERTSPGSWAVAVAFGIARARKSQARHERMTGQLVAGSDSWW